MIISLFHNHKDNAPHSQEVTWTDLANALSDVRTSPCTLETCRRGECPHKHGMAWSPAVWPKGSTRRASTVEAVHALVVDIDHVHPTEVDDVIARLMPYQFVLHASHSDHPEDRCLRAVLAVSRPVTGAEFKRFWRAAMAYLGLPADEQTKDASRLYFTPSRPSDACGDGVDGDGFLFLTQDGVELDVDAIMATAEPEKMARDYIDGDGRVASSDTEVERATDQAIRDAAQVLADAWPSEGRHSAQLALAGALARASWSVEDVAEFCAAVAEIQQPGNADYGKRLAAAQSSAEKIAAGDAVAGWPRLADMIGDAAVSRATALLGVGQAMAEPDPDFMAVIDRHARGNAEERSQVEAPTSAAVKAAVEAAITKYGRSTDASKRLDGDLLKRVQRNEYIFDDTTLAQATLAVLKVAPSATTDQQIAGMLAIAAGSDRDVPDLVRSARAHLKSTTESAVQEFTVDLKTGKPVSIDVRNYDVALAKLGVTLRYNRFSELKLLTRNNVEDVLQDEHVLCLLDEIERTFGFSPSKEKFRDYLDARAYNHSFNPTLDYLASLPAREPTDRLDTWLIRLCGAKDTPYVRAVSRIVLVAAVRRVRSPGCKFDEMLVLESPRQGTTKTTFVKTLCPLPDLFGDDIPLHSDDKAKMEATAGKWIIEASELAGMSRTDHNSLKSYLSKQKDQARLAYGRETKHRPRHFIIIGTTNDQQYLRDQTGNRRYWPILIVRCDVEGLKAELDELWAEAAAAEARGESIRLSEELWNEAATEQEARRISDAFEINIDTMLGDYAQGIILVEDVRKVCDVGKKCSTVDQQRINAVMAARGWERKKRRFMGKLRDCFSTSNATHEWLTVKQAPDDSWELVLALGPGAKSNVQHPNTN